MTSIIKVDQIQKADGSTPTAGDLGLNTTGTVLQVVRGYLDTRPAFGANQNVWVDSGLSATITPLSSSNKIYAQVSVTGWHTAATGDSNFRFRYQVGAGSWSDVNPPSSFTGSSVTALVGNHRFDSSGGWYEGGLRVTYPTLHEPNTTSAVTYRLELTTELSTLTLNRGRQDSAVRFGSAVSEIILMEIAG
jgi:hypothetical protein